MDWKNRRVVVTGATGLLGGHLCEALVNLGAQVVAVVRDFVPSSRYYQIDKIWEVQGDIRDFDFVNRVLNEYQAQTVFHLAAQTQVGVANTNPYPTLQTNIMGTVNILEACRINKVNQVLVASSDKAYGIATELPYDEQTPLAGVYPYDVSKSCADLLAQSYGRSFGMSVGITRCGNLFGPGDLNFNRLIPGTIRALLCGENPVIRSDGLMVRDYFYVKDAVRAYLLLAESIERHPRVDAFNFSYGLPMSVLKMVDAIAKAMRVNYAPDIRREASREIPEQYLDSSKASNLLQWAPMWGLFEGLQETIEWYKENL